MPEFEYEGVDELMELIAKLPDLATQAGQPAMTDAVLFLHGEIPEYPPALPESSYVRTGTLGRRFTTNVEENPLSIIGELGNNVNYAPWVVGDSFPGSEINGVMKYQAKVHRGRWWQFNQVIDDNIERAWEVFDETFLPEFRDMIVKESGGKANAK